MTDIIIHEEENSDIPVEEIVEDLTETTETVVEELSDAIETLSETIEEITEDNQHICDPHCVEIHNRLQSLEEKIAVTQQAVVEEIFSDSVTEDNPSDPEPEPEVTPEPEPEAEPESTEVVPEETETTIIEPPTDRNKPSGPNGFFRALKAIGF